METTSSITAGHAVLETVIGFMGIAWSEKGLIRLCLPERSREAVERRLMRHAGVSASTAQPQWVVDLIASIKAYAAGEDVDFTGVPVDLDGVDDFRLAIYDAARKLGYGQTTTYGELAKRAGQAACRAKPVQPLAPIRYRWSFRATASLPPAARSAASRRRAARTPRKRCWPWKACASAHRRRRRFPSGSEGARIRLVARHKSLMAAQEAVTEMLVVGPLADVDRAGFGVGARHIGAFPHLAHGAELLALHIAVVERQPGTRVD